MTLPKKYLNRLFIRVSKTPKKSFFQVIFFYVFCVIYAHVSQKILFARGCLSFNTNKNAQFREETAHFSEKNGLFCLDVITCKRFSGRAEETQIVLVTRLGCENVHGFRSG